MQLLSPVKPLLTELLSFGPFSSYPKGLLPTSRTLPEIPLSECLSSTSLFSSFRVMNTYVSWISSWVTCSKEHFQRPFSITRPNSFLCASIRYCAHFNLSIYKLMPSFFVLPPLSTHPNCKLFEGQDLVFNVSAFSVLNTIINI